MFCANCGKQLYDGDSFCPGCGQPVQDRESDTEVIPNVEELPNTEATREPITNLTTTNTSSNCAASRPSHTKILVYGIIACAFSLTLYLSFVGIIMGKLGLNLYEEYINTNAPFSRQADIGRILSKVGFIVGIVLTIIAVITLIALA